MICTCENDLKDVQASAGRTSPDNPAIPFKYIHIVVISRVPAANCLDEMYTYMLPTCSQLNIKSISC